MEENESLHTEALERFAIAEQAEKSQRELAIEDLRFAHAEDGQWDESAILKRKDRPRYTINKIAGALDQLVGDQRQNRTNIKIFPKGLGAKKDTAKTLAGLIRSIESESKATNAYDNAFDELIGGGYGGWRIATKYNEDDIFEQDIVIKPINSAATSLWLDSSAQEYDKRDAKWGFLSYDMPKSEFKDKFPKATISEFDQLKYSSDLHSGWYRDDVVRVAEYWVKEPIVKKLAKLSDGRVIDLEEEAQVIDELKDQGITVLKTRNVKAHKVVMYLMSGGEILKGPMEWAGKYIPLIPAYGKTIKIEGKRYVRGMVRFAKDPSRIYNYATSAAIEASALSPKDPIWMTAVQAEGHEDKLRKFNTQNSPFMFYNPDQLAPPPARSGAPAVQQAIIMQIQQAGLDIHATTGLEPASLGNVPELKSGKAIEAQQRMGDRGSYIFTDNLHKSIAYTGEILIDLIPKIYDTQRMIHILNLDGTTEETQLNAKQLDPLGQPVLDEQTCEVITVNDLTVGKYGVSVKAGPAFNTQRQESAQQLIDLTASSPVFEQVATDLIAKNLNVLEGDELTKRVRALMIKQGIVQPTEEEVKELGLDNQQPDPSEQALQDNVASQTALNIASVANKDADTLAKKVKAQQETARTLQIITDTIINKVNEGLALTPAENDIIVKQYDIVGEGQQALDEGPNSEQRSEIVQGLREPQSSASGEIPPIANGA